MSQIRPWLFIGGIDEAQDGDLLASLGITHILNVADNVQINHGDRFEYLHLPARDFGMDEGIQRVFPAAEAFARDQLFDGRVPASDELFRFQERKLLVNCFMGINRSVTVTLALMMSLEGSSLKKAWTAVRHGRRQASPYKDNCAILVNFERERFGSNSMSVHELG
eukprot:m.32640 g.32640  ORF g.32640 m.32640 type:complete len:166 (+) comp12166_c0_seq3:124-621(+)